MSTEYLRDLLFDFINENNELDVKDIYWDSESGVLRLTAWDGSKFLLRIEAV